VCAIRDDDQAVSSSSELCKRVQKRDKGLVVNTPWKKSLKKKRRRVTKVTYTFRCLLHSLSRHFRVCSFPSLLLSRLLNLSFRFFFFRILWLTVYCHSFPCYLLIFFFFSSSKLLRLVSLLFYLDENFHLFWLIMTNKRSLLNHVRLFWIPNIRSDTRSYKAI
jgi:hypothetical protein